MSSEPYFGHAKERKVIHDLITHPRESYVINLVGTYGSGRSFLLDYICSQLTDSLWNLPQGRDAVTIQIQGQHFIKTDELLVFLAKQILYELKRKYSDLWEQYNLRLTETDIIDDLLYALETLTAEDFPIVVMVDNFTRVLERIEKNELEGLNRLRMSGIHYILVTYYRTIREIIPTLFFISEFLKDAKAVFLTALSRSEALSLLHYKNRVLSNGRCELSNETLEAIYEIAGGHPGLLLTVLQHFLFKYCQDEETTPLTLQEEQLKNTLRFLPDDADITYYLDKLQESIQRLPSIEQAFLLDIAIELLESRKSKWQTYRQQPKLLQHFQVMGLIGKDTTHLTTEGKLIQYMLANHLMTEGFSPTERHVLEALLRVYPSLLPFDEISSTLAELADFSDELESKRQFVDSTISRVRKKLNSLPNRKAYTIRNVRGQGFYMTKNISFDMFYFSEQGAKIFRE